VLVQPDLVLVRLKADTTELGEHKQPDAGHDR